MSSWAPGELERLQEFLRLRQSRIDFRYELELALVADSDAPYLASQDNFAALVRDAVQAKQPPEDDEVLFPDSPVVKNQDLWVMAAGDITLISATVDEDGIGLVELTVELWTGADQYEALIDDVVLHNKRTLPPGDPFTLILSPVDPGSRVIEIVQYDLFDATLDTSITVEVPPYVPPGGNRPTAQMVADLVRTRLIEEAGHMSDGGSGTPVDTFTDSTYPTLTAAERLIDQAVMATVGQIPDSIVEGNQTGVRHLNALYAAILIEGSYFREQLTDDQVELYWELYKAGIRGIVNTTSGGGGSAAAGGGPGMVDSVVAVGVHDEPYPDAYA